jgi:hypothetical protein
VLVERVGVESVWVDGLDLVGGSLDVLLKYGIVVVVMALVEMEETGGLVEY